ncbi:MAG: hypothetical protein JXA50_03280 [Deltaproteobacteria bacterium]|nr:hypothetical protein [Deltaproteobacteria bacterium]
MIDLKKEIGQGIDWMVLEDGGIKLDCKVPFVVSNGKPQDIIDLYILIPGLYLEPLNRSLCFFINYCTYDTKFIFLFRHHDFLLN